MQGKVKGLTIITFVGGSDVDTYIQIVPVDTEM